jgi:hypothetical protein
LRTSAVLSGRTLNELLVVSFASSCWREADDRKILIFFTREVWQFILGNTYLIVATIQQAVAAGVTIFPKPLLGGDGVYEDSSGNELHEYCGISCRTMQQQRRRCDAGPDGVSVAVVLQAEF